MEKNTHKFDTKRWKLLSEAERKIFNALLNSFPATPHESAYDAALQGGVKHQFIPT